VTAGEVLALVIGMRLLSRGDNLWVSTKNDLLLGIDVLTGMVMVICSVVGSMSNSAVLNTAVAVSLLAHGYREWEYLAQVGNAFCANLPLFVMGNVKLVGLVISSGLSLLQLLGQ
jgi:hypothetical protein